MHGYVVEILAASCLVDYFKKKRRKKKKLVSIKHSDPAALAVPEVWRIS